MVSMFQEMVIGGRHRGSIRKTADFITENKITVPRFYILTPIPGMVFMRNENAGRLMRIFIGLTVLLRYTSLRICLRNIDGGILEIIQRGFSLKVSLNAQF